MPEMRAEKPKKRIPTIWPVRAGNPLSFQRTTHLRPLGGCNFAIKTGRAVFARNNRPASFP